MRHAARFSWFLILALAFSAAALSGCGDDGEDDGGGEESAASSQGEERSGTPKEAAVDNKPEPFPVVVLKTSLGEVTIKLNREKAPLTVQNFLNYCASRHYDGTIFHQVVRDQLVLGGGYDSEFVEKAADNTVRNEADNGLKNVRGTISMARRPDSIDSGTCQFFINLADNAYLDQTASDPAQPDAYGYCVFGEVISGLDVVEQISQSDIGNRQVTGADQKSEEIPNVPKRTVMIKSVEHVRR